MTNKIGVVEENNQINAKANELKVKLMKYINRKMEERRNKF